MRATLFDSPKKLLATGLAFEAEDDDFFAIDVPPAVNQQDV